MPRGGRRPGAGRKKGSATKKTRAVANRVAREGITPLEVLVAAMRKHYDDGELDKAASIAADAAPYCHPRLAAVQHSGNPRQPIQVIERLELVDGHASQTTEGPSRPAPVSAE